MGMSPPVIAKLYSMIPKEILEGNMDPIHLEKYLKDFDGKTPDSKEKAIPKLDDKENVEQKENDKSNEGATETANGINYEIDPLSRETSLPPAIHKKDDFGPSGGTPSETSTAQGDQPVF
jgi:hypothetical protein